MDNHQANIIGPVLGPTIGPKGGPKGGPSIPLLYLTCHVMFTAKEQRLQYRSLMTSKTYPNNTNNTKYK